MTPGEARVLARAALRRVAPDADVDVLAGDAPVDETLGLDSVDFLAFVAGLEDRAGISVPERDYPRLATVDSCAAYLTERTRASQAED